MTFKPYKLAQLVVAYEAHFRTHVPLEAMKVLQPVDLVGLIKKALATNTPMAKTGFGWGWDHRFSPRGCCIIEDESATPAKLPNGDWLH